MPLTRTNWDETTPISEDNLNNIEDRIDEAFQNLEDGKGVIVQAINDKDISASITDTHAELGNKIRKIIDAKFETINLVLPQRYETGSTSHVFYIDIPETNASLEMFIDNIAISDLRSMATCNLQTFEWNFTVENQGYGTAYYETEDTKAILRYRPNISTGLQRIELRITQVSNQYRLSFYTEWRNAMAAVTYQIPIKIFGKVTE
jgi:hypothetical protein